MPKPDSRSPSDGFYDALGHTIKVARTDLGIDRKELAETAGISYSYLAAIENGRKQPSSQVLLSIADALGLRTHQLLESAEGRRERSLRATEEYPSWLVGRPPAGAGAARRPTPAASAFDPGPSPPPTRGSTTAAFLDELAELAAGIPEPDRRLLLDLARKLAGR
jgi:transcriptional regulator with XRE-family HTH domain